MNARNLSPAVLSVILLASCASTPPDPELEFTGRRLAETNCQSCHAIALFDQSAHPQAPAFRDLSSRYPIDALTDAFADGIGVGHPDMPDFPATEQEVAAIVAYVKSIQP